MPFQPYITSYNINITRFVGIVGQRTRTEHEHKILGSFPSLLSGHAASAVPEAAELAFVRIWASC